MYKPYDINSSDITNDNSTNYSDIPSLDKNNKNTLIWIIAEISGGLFIIIITIIIIIVKMKEMNIKISYISIITAKIIKNPYQ